MSTTTVVSIAVAAMILASCDSDPVVPTGPIAGVDQSDDYELFQIAFQEAARSLIGDGECAEADFEYYGGWVRSVNTPGRYFTYCTGGDVDRIATVNDRFYVVPGEDGTYRITQ